MATQSQKDSIYHCGIGGLLTAAYSREFDIMEAGKCKRTYPTFDDWYNTLSDDQKRRVDHLLKNEFST